MKEERNGMVSSEARMEIAVYPLETGKGTITKELTSIFTILDECHIQYQVTTMGTIVEGNVDELFSLARKLHDSVFSDTVKRVITCIKIHERR